MPEPGRRRPVIVGFGNRWRGDDAAGPLAVERLAALGYDTVEVEADGTLLLDARQGRDRAIVVDAMNSGAAPGSVRRFEAAGAHALPDDLPKGVFRSSTHLIGLAEAIELARTLGKLPRRLTVFGIEGADYGYGAPLSPQVEAALPAVVRDVAAMADSAVRDDGRS